MEIGYRPVLGDVPEFNFPAILPNLPNVAVDIVWSGMFSTKCTKVGNGMDRIVSIPISIF